MKWSEKTLWVVLAAGIITAGSAVLVLRGRREEAHPAPVDMARANEKPAGGVSEGVLQQGDKHLTMAFKLEIFELAWLWRQPRPKNPFNRERFETIKRDFSDNLGIQLTEEDGHRIAEESAAAKAAGRHEARHLINEHLAGKLTHAELVAKAKENWDRSTAGALMHATGISRQQYDALMTVDKIRRDKSQPEKEKETEKDEHGH